MDTSFQPNKEQRIKATPLVKKRGVLDLVWEYKEQIVTTSLIIFFGAFSALGIYEFGMVYGILAVLIGIGLPLLIYACFELHVGVNITLIASFFILGILRFVDLPLGLLMDFLILIFLLSTLIRMGSNKEWDTFKNPVSVMVLVWIVYNLLAVANPGAASRLGWVYTIRGMAGALVFYYITLYAFKNYRIVNGFVQLWVFLTLLLALYALFQEFHGLLPFEEAWIKADEERFGLFYNWGHFRKCSYFCDPTNFGITVAYSAVFCFVLSLGPCNIFVKLYYWFCAGAMALSMVFSGTRTAYVLIPAGMAFLTVLTLRRGFIFMSILFFTVGAGIIFSPIRSIGPLNENALTRLRSAFMPEEDPSFQVRLKNQAFIKPFIHSHPLGGGLGSVGDWGKRFSPESPLANFPPDSGFVKIAVELGWLGMLIYCSMLFVVLKIGIRNYHLLKDLRLKTLQAGLLCVLFCMIVGNYAQEAITMYPSSMIFYAGMAILTLTPKLDTNET